jgi:hypothetical protein
VRRIHNALIPLSENTATINRYHFCEPVPIYKEEKCQSWVRIEIRETTEELKTLMRQEKDVWRHEKLQVLYWLKTQTVDSVLSAAVRLGKHRTTIQRWLSSYRSGGIGELLSSEASLRQTQNYECPNCRETRKRIERTRRI